MTELYEPPAFDSDEELDQVELALVAALADIIADEILEEAARQDAAAERPTARRRA